MKTRCLQLAGVVLILSLILGPTAVVRGQQTRDPAAASTTAPTGPKATSPAAPAAPILAPEAAPEAKPEANPGTTPEAKPGTTPEVKPGANPEAKPEANPEVKPEAAVPPPALPEPIDFRALASQVGTLTVPVVWQRLPRFGLALFANAAQSEAQPAQGTAIPASYTLGPGDELTVLCFSEVIEHLNTRAVVSPEGKIYLPLAGEVSVLDSTLGAASLKIAQLLRQFYPKSQVTVSLSQPRVVEVYVLGDVLRPGKYALPGMGSIFSALYAAGGPSDIGSLRRVKLLPLHGEPRDYDLYSYLLEGERISQQPLSPGDTIFVGTQQAEVGAVGEVRRSARYEIKPDTTCADLIKMAGGIAPMAYTPNIQVWRVQQGELRTIAGLTLKEATKFMLQDGDLVVIRPILEEARQVVSIEGAVRRPGMFDLTPELHVADLIAKAEGVADNAHLGKAVLWRLGQDLHWEVQGFQVAKALAGSADDNPVLRASDRIQIFTQEEAERPQVVEISGALRRPGEFQWGARMKVGDLIAMSGGLLPTAYGERAFLWRMNETMDYELSTFSLDAVLKGQLADDLLLQPQDRVVILAKTDVRQPDVVTITGAIRKPDSYEWGAGMRVRDLVMQAGGVSPEVYGSQATLIRFRDSDTEREVVQVRLAAALQGDKEADLELSRGDLLHIFTKDEQRQKSEVWVDGSVQRPGAYARYENMKISDIIFAAGGLTPEASGEGVHSLARQVGQVHDTHLKIKREAGRIIVEPDLMLGDDDYVAISGVGAFVRRPPHVKITGRVATPGSYGLDTDAGHSKTVYDMLQEAGGLLPDANPRGILLFRTKSELWLNRQDLLQKALAGLNRTQGVVPDALPTAEPATATRPSASAEQVALGGQVAKVFSKGAGDEQVVGVMIPPRNLNLASLVKTVPIDGEKLIATKGKEGDAVLTDDDYIVVQRILDTVAVFGAVAQSGEIAFRPHENVRSAVQRVGGLAEDADPRYTTVLRANGTTLPESKVTELQQGDIVIVPSKYLMKTEGNKPGFLDRLWNGLMQAFALSRIIK